MKKRLLTLCLAITMLLSTVPMVSAEELASPDNGSSSPTKVTQTTQNALEQEPATISGLDGTSEPAAAPIAATAVEDGFTWEIKTFDENDVSHEHYNVGEKIVAKIYVTSPTMEEGETNYFTSFGLALSYDTTKMTLTALTNAVTGTWETKLETGKGGFVITDTNAIPVDNDTPLHIATATFTVTAASESKEKIDFSESEMTYPNEEVGRTIAELPAEVQLHDIKLTLTSGSNTAFTVGGDGDKTAYVKYQEKGLYADSARTQPFTMPIPETITAAENFRLATGTGENLWKNQDGGVYADSATITDYAGWTKDLTLTVQTVETVTLSFTSGSNGSLSDSSKTIVIDKNTTLGADIAAQFPTANADTGHEFDGWYDGDTKITPASYTAVASKALEARFVPETYTLEKSAPSGLVSFGGDATGSSVTYGEPVDFTIVTTAGAMLRNVYYTVGTSTNRQVPTDNGSGSYTIPGTNVTGDITIVVDAFVYHTITFATGSNTTTEATALTAYVEDGEVGLYSSAADILSGTPNFTIPTVTAISGYRLAKDDATEPLWGSYTTTALRDTAVFTNDTTLTAQTVQQFTVTFQQNNGTLIGEVMTVDAGYKLLASDYPTSAVVPGTGMELKGWSLGGNNGNAIPDLTDVTVSSDLTITALLQAKSYSITFATSSAGTFTDFTGVSGTEGSYTATYNTDVTFKVSAEEGYTISNVKYQAGSQSAQTLTAEGGIYIIPGSALVDTINVTIEAEGLHTVTFLAGANGAVGGTTSFSVTENASLGNTEFAKVTTTADTGYAFKYWYTLNETVETRVDNPEDVTITAAITFYAKFDHGTFNISATGLSIDGAEVTHGTDYTFTPTATGKIVTSVSATVGGNTIPVTVDDDGSYTIAGGLLTGDVTVSFDSFAGEMTFISIDTYKGLEVGTKILVLTSDNADTTKTYHLGDGSQLFRSEKYSVGGSYLKIVDENATVAELSQGLGITDATRDALAYGHMNTDNQYTMADASVMNSVLHGKVIVDGEEKPATLSERQRLSADYDGSKTVTTNDICEVIRIWLDT